MLSDKVKTLFDQAINFEKLSWDQYCHCILNIKLRTTVLHNSRVGKYNFFRGVITLLNFKTPFLVILFQFALLFFVFFHSENVV